MITNHNRKLILRFFLLVTTLFLYTGCAKTPWTNQLANEDAQSYLSTINTIQQQRDDCPQDWDADVNISWHTALGTKAFAGYLQVSNPSSFKFIVSNPLGQPILVLTSNGKKFQLLNTLSEQYTHGSTLSYALHNNIPAEFASGSWGYWLVGRMAEQVTESPSISLDKENRGVWLTVDASLESSANITSYYLLDLEKTIILEQRLFDAENKQLADFTYSKYKPVGTCLQPHQIDIANLPFGASIQVNLNNIQPLGIATEKDFTLPIPQHYFIKYLP